MPTVSLPYTITPGEPENASHVQANDEALRDGVNTISDANIGTALTSASLAAGTALANLATGSVTDAKLASPNNSVYKTILAADGAIGLLAGAGVYIVGNHFATAPDPSPVTVMNSGSSGSDTAAMPAVYIDDADFAVGSLTAKLRLRAQVSVNIFAPARTFTFGLYPITVAGGANALTATLGTVVASSTVAIASPSASTITSGVSSDVNVPSDGLYCIGMSLSGALATDSACYLTAQLQARNT